MWGRAGSWVVLWALLWAAGGCAPEYGKSDLPPRLIAHAGGIGNQRTDTNSLEALNASVSRGHTVIEVDFSWTTDGHLVLLHNWEESLKKLFDGATGTMTLAEFRSLEALDGLSHLSLDDLVGWLEKTPEILIVTDIKARNIDGLRLISEKYPGWRSRFVPQIFAPESIAEVRRIGFDRVILSLYRSDLPDSRIVEFALENRPWAVTIPVRRAVEGNLSKELSVRGVRVFAHTVNDHQTVGRLRDSGVFGVYTDWLSPADRDLSCPLPEWSETVSGEIQIKRWIVPFLSWGMDGMEATMELRSSSQFEVDVHLSFRSPDGGVLASDTIRVSGAETSRVDLGKAASGNRGHGWAEDEISVSVSGGPMVVQTLRWDPLGRFMG